MVRMEQVTTPEDGICTEDGSHAGLPFIAVFNSKSGEACRHWNGTGLPEFRHSAEGTDTALNIQTVKAMLR